jgi:hypothetical protein
MIQPQKAEVPQLMRQEPRSGVNQTRLWCFLHLSVDKDIKDESTTNPIVRPVKPIKAMDILKGPLIHSHAKRV